MRHDIPEGSRETDFALGWLTWGRIRCGPWVHEWYLSVKRKDRRYLFVLGNVRPITFVSIEPEWGGGDTEKAAPTSGVGIWYVRRGGWAISE